MGFTVCRLGSLDTPSNTAQPHVAASTHVGEHFPPISTLEHARTRGAPASVPWETSQTIQMSRQAYSLTFSAKCRPNFIPLYSCRLVTFTIEADLANTQRTVAALPGRRRWHLHHETSMGILAAVRRPDQCIWVKRTRMDIMQHIVTFFPLQSLNTPILKQTRTKIEICSALFCL